MKQLRHIEIKNDEQQFPITIVCDKIRTPENIGMCFRVSESFGVQKIYLHKNSPSIKNKTVQKTSRNTIEYISYHFYDDFQQLITHLKKQGNTIIGIEITDESIHIENFDFLPHQKIVFLIGNERNGIKDINLADYTIAIPMYGRNSSMNVIHSLAITLYTATNQLKNKI